MLYVREDILFYLIAFRDKPANILFIELNLENSKIVRNYSYNPHKSEIKKPLTAITNSLDLYSSKFEEIFNLSDFNEKIEGTNMKLFCENYNLKCLMKQLTCYNNPNKSTSIDFILTKVPRMLQSTRVIETGMSVMRKTFKKIRPRTINYRSNRDLCNE